ncbi:hypothetical protein P691DRAFT_613255, partial [Macrolepiota fuliginosa MF-IS2]
YQQLYTIIKSTILKNCDAGLPINVLMTQVMIQGYIEAMAPELLRQGFKCSYHFTQHFLEAELRWSYRTGTCAAQKTPENWKVQCEEMFF